MCDDVPPSARRTSALSRGRLTARADLSSAFPGRCAQCLQHLRQHPAGGRVAAREHGWLRELRLALVDAIQSRLWREPACAAAVCEVVGAAAAQGEAVQSILEAGGSYVVLK